jgi:hypothetical protein
VNQAISAWSFYDLQANVKRNKRISLWSESSNFGLVVLESAGKC